MDVTHAEKFEKVMFVLPLPQLPRAFGRLGFKVPSEFIVGHPKEFPLEPLPTVVLIHRPKPPTRLLPPNRRNHSKIAGESGGTPPIVCV